MIQLGRHAQDGQVSRVEDLANKEDVSSNFLVQILNDLRRAGMVSSRRGKMGGYALAKAPNEITLADVVKAIEGGVLSIDSDRKGESGERVAAIWEGIAQDIIDDAVQVSNEDAFAMARRLAVEEGIPAGISTGANVWSAIEVAKREGMAGKRIVTVSPSPTERYLSTPLAEETRAEVANLPVAELPPA